MQERLRKGKDVNFIRASRRPQKPARDAWVNIGVIDRFRCRVDVALWLRIENTLRDIVMTEIAAWGGAVAVSAFTTTAVAALWTNDAMGRTMTGFGYVVAVFSALSFAYILKFYFDKITRQIRSSYAHRGDKRPGSETLSLTFSQAEKVTTKAQEVLGDCLPAKTREKIASIRSDRATPYRVLRNYLPIGPLFFRQPRQYRLQQMPDGEYVHYRFGIDIADALCAGVLGMAGARPRLRYSEDTDIPLAQDRYWRNDVQELPDAAGGDIFLRFHQSTVEGDFPPSATTVDVCTLKTYACINNFRETPIYLLRVRDIVDCLRGESPHASPEQQHALYEDLAIDGRRAFELLSAAIFAKQSARADRFRYEAIADPIGKPIFAYGDNEDDVIMSFDPGRVWPRTDAGIESKHAVIALRRAIHLASRKAAVEVKLTRQDVLLIDNLRMMIARREDNPTGLATPLSLARDIVAAAAPPLAGRWLRQIYGFPPRVSSRQSAEASESELTDVALSEARDAHIRVREAENTDELAVRP